MAVAFAFDGILHLMAQNVQNQRLLKELFGFHQPESTLTVTANIEGYCNQVPKGHIRVGFWIGKCESFSLGDGHTGWLSMSQIVIEEVPPPQA